MNPRSTEFRRRPPSKPERKRYLVVCEGEKTEPAYLLAMNKFWGNPAFVEIARHECSSPREIVQYAVELKKVAKSQAKRDPLWEYDSIWCFFDRDEHPHIPEAFDRAQANGIRVAFSDPNFELWLLLHFQEQTAFLERTEAARICEESMPGYSKEPDIKVLTPRYADAAQRAAALRARQTRNDRVRQNPWTEVDVFLESLRPLT